MSSNAAVTSENLCEELGTRITKLKVPNVGDKGLQICLGVLNCFLFGWGCMIAGCMTNNMADVVLGLMQLVIPFVGWIWAVFWGVLMAAEGLNMDNGGGEGAAPAEPAETA